MGFVDVSWFSQTWNNQFTSSSVWSQEPIRSFTFCLKMWLRETLLSCLIPKHLGFPAPLITGYLTRCLVSSSYWFHSKVNGWTGRRWHCCLEEVLERGLVASPPSHLTPSSDWSHLFGLYGKWRTGSAMCRTIWPRTNSSRSHWNKQEPFCPNSSLHERAARL